MDGHCFQVVFNIIGKIGKYKFVFFLRFHFFYSFFLGIVKKSSFIALY